MKKRRSTIFIVSMLLLLYGLLLMLMPQRAGRDQPNYTALSTNFAGVSLLYDTLELMGYPVRIGMRQIGPDTSVHDVQIVVQPLRRYFSQEDALEWVHRGGRLVLAQYDWVQLSNARRTHRNEYFSVYSYGLGQVIIGYTGDLLNGALMENSFPGVFIAHMLDTWGYDSIVFNQFYHGLQENPTLWRVLPTGFRMVVYQAILLMLAVILYLGKRFGRPVPYYEETERDKDEFAKSLAAIYSRAGLGQVAVESHYKLFLRQCGNLWGCPPEEVQTNIVERWENAGLPDKELLEGVEHYLHLDHTSLNTKTKSGRQICLKIIKDIETLEGWVVYDGKGKNTGHNRNDKKTN